MCDVAEENFSHRGDSAGISPAVHQANHRPFAIVAAAKPAFDPDPDFLGQIALCRDRENNKLGIGGFPGGIRSLDGIAQKRKRPPKDFKLKLSGALPGQLIAELNRVLPCRCVFIDHNNAARFRGRGSDFIWREPYHFWSRWRL